MDTLNAGVMTKDLVNLVDDPAATQAVTSGEFIVRRRLEQTREGGLERELKVKSTAGTTESSDILIMLEPRTEGGISLELSSNVLQQFGKEIRAVILETLEQYGVQHAYVIAVDKGALNCTIRARTATAIFRSAQSQEYIWEVPQDV